MSACRAITHTAPKEIMDVAEQDKHLLVAICRSIEFFGRTAILHIEEMRSSDEKKLNTQRTMLLQASSIRLIGPANEKPRRTYHRF